MTTQEVLFTYRRKLAAWHENPPAVWPDLKCLVPGYPKAEALKMERRLAKVMADEGRIYVKNGDGRGKVQSAMMPAVGPTSAGLKRGANGRVAQGMEADAQLSAALGKREMTIPELCEALGKRESTVRNILYRMLKRGQVTRRDGSDNRNPRYLYRVAI